MYYWTGTKYDNTYSGERYFEITFANPFHYDEIQDIVIYNRSSTTDLKNKMKNVTLEFYNTSDSRFPDKGYYVKGVNLPGHMATSVYGLYGHCYPHSNSTRPTYYNTDMYQMNLPINLL